MNQLTVRKAAPEDVPSIHRLLEHYADLGIVLRRTPEDIMRHLRNFYCAETPEGIRGCSAIRDFGNNLLEVRSLVIAPEYQGRGIGRAVIAAIVRDVNRERRRWRLFTLTGQPEFFVKQGFRTVSRDLFPEKIWSDCRNCPKSDCCDEIALMMTDEDYRASSQR